MRTLPDPETCPTIPAWPDAGQALGLGRSATYQAIAAGTIPSIRVGRRVLVPTARLRALLGMNGASAAS